MREAQAHSQQRTAELRTRLEAEPSVAAASVQVINREEFWVNAAPDDLSRLYATAHAWEGVDPQLGAAAAMIRDEVRERYGLDVADLALVNQLHGDSARERAEAREQRHLEDVDGDATVLAADGGEGAQAGEEYQRAVQARAGALATTAGDRAGIGDDGAAAVSGDPTSKSGEAAGIDYDSRQRRDALAQQLEAAAPPDAVAARVLADTGQAKSTRLAVSTQPTRPQQGAKTASLAKPQQLSPEHRRSR